MRTTLIAATALTLSAAALAQDYETTPVDGGAVTEPVAEIDSPASTAPEPVAHDPSLEAVAPDAATTAPPSPETAITDTSSQNLQTFAGMGGPYEEVYGGSTGTPNLQPRPADQNYPPCSPGPGDDNCIQLYEPGVRQQIASWSQPTGGLADGTPTTAMGGPFEPADSGPADASVSDISANAPAITSGEKSAKSGAAKPAANDTMQSAATSEAEVPQVKRAAKKA